MYKTQIRSLLIHSILAVAALAVVAGISAPVSLAHGHSGAVYVLTNQSTGNSVMVFRRAPDGALSFAGTFMTGGKGAGTGADPLGSQGALMLGRGHRLLFAVNAGSNDVSVFAVRRDRLQLLDRVPSGGQMPVSITVHGRLVYVLNAGGVPNIKGFIIDPCPNHLVPLRGSRRRLSGGSAAAPAEVSFSPDGGVLMVTEKGTSKIDTYTVNDDGYASDRMATASNGSTPFGFAFIHRDIAVVSEAGPGALSSYDVDEDGNLEVVTGSMSDGQKAGCWVVVTADGRYAYLANSASNSIGSYTVTRDGDLSLLNPVAALSGSGSIPIDMALSTDSRFLYVRNGGNNTVAAYKVESDGSLTSVGAVDGIPAGAQGIAAR
ncbi:MAG: lactonase family protein [Terriglobia bacterium]